MAQTRSATSNGGIIALILVGGAVATGVAIIFTIVRLYVSPDLAGFRTSALFFLIECFFVGLVAGAAVLITRPRGPLAPIAAAVAAYVAMEVGVRIGAILSVPVSFQELPPSELVVESLKPVLTRYQAYELLAALLAAGLAGLRVVMASASTGSHTWNSRQPGGAFGGQGQPMPGRPPAPGQPYQPPPSYQPPHTPGPGPGTPLGGPQGGPPPYGGS